MNNIKEFTIVHYAQSVIITVQFCPIMVALWEFLKLMIAFFLDQPQRPRKKTIWRNLYQMYRLARKIFQFGSG